MNNLLIFKTNVQISFFYDFISFVNLSTIIFAFLNSCSFFRSIAPLLICNKNLLKAKGMCLSNFL